MFQAEFALVVLAARLWIIRGKDMVKGTRASRCSLFEGYKG
jgi:hypothetical protein